MENTNTTIKSVYEAGNLPGLWVVEYYTPGYFQRLAFKSKQRPEITQILEQINIRESAGVDAPNKY